MKSSAIALAIIFAIIAAGACLGFLAGARRKLDLEQWTVGGRGFGVLLVYLLVAGEVYTTFSFLGASGWAYSRGGPALYIMAYLTLAYVVSFFILPPIWELGRRFELHTESDFFTRLYGSKYLGAFVCLTGVVFLIPYIQLQLTGLGIIVEVASFDGIRRGPAMAIAVIVLASFVLASGVRAVAWVGVLKDALMVLAALAIGIGVPYVHFGGIGNMYAAVARVRPSHLTMPGATSNLGHPWFISTVLVTSLGFYMWPHSFASTFTAKSGDIVRRNSVVMPLYTLTLAFIFFAGFSAVVALPHLANGDMALLAIVRSTFPAWFLGVIGGAGALTAMVPAAVYTLTAGALFAKNFYRPLFAPGMTDDQVTKLARVVVVVLNLVCLGFAIHSSTTLVSLLLLGYSGVAQFFPGVVLGLYWKRVTMAGVFTGLVLGVGTVAILTLTKHDPLFGLNAGFIALCLNFLVCVLVSKG